MLAGLQRVLVPLGVQGVDERVVDHLDFWIVNDIGVGLVHPFDATLGCKRLRPGSVAGGHGDQPVAEQSGRIDDPVIGNAGSAENADLERGHQRGTQVTGAVDFAPS